MSEINKVCYCDRTSCFASRKSIVYPEKQYCSALQDNDFGDKECPFFKTKEEQRLSLNSAALRKMALEKERKERKRKTHIRQESGVEFGH